MIEAYKFGEMVVDGERYTRDLIVFPEKVIDGWWRREGHKLHLEDLEEALKDEPKPDVLVVGTGYHGLVKVLPEVKNALKSRGIKLTAQPTRAASQTFNRILKSEKRVVGAFHLTC